MTQQERDHVELMMQREAIRFRNRFITLAVIFGTWLAIALS